MILMTLDMNISDMIVVAVQLFFRMSDGPVFLESDQALTCPPMQLWSDLANVLLM